jgi:hypothetical protein
MQERDRITFITTSFRDVWASCLVMLGNFFMLWGRKKEGKGGRKREKEKNQQYFG